MKLSVIFEAKPRRQDLRGDPYFWDYLKKYAENMDIISLDELQQWINEGVLLSFRETFNREIYGLCRHKAVYPRSNELCRC